MNSGARLRLLQRAQTSRTRRLIYMARNGLFLLVIVRLQRANLISAARTMRCARWALGRDLFGAFEEEFRWRTGLGFEDVVGGGEEMSDKITVDTSPSEELTAPLAQGEIEKRNDS